MELNHEYNSALIGDLETWRCVHCGDNNATDGPPQCGCGTMKPGYECCSWCESYGPLVTFTKDTNGETMCTQCQQLYHSNTGVPLYIGWLVVGAVILVLWAIWVVVG